MAKESMKAREVKRAKLVARYAEKREALKKIIATSNDPAEAYEAARKLQAIPKNANPIRLHNRCKITGRPSSMCRLMDVRGEYNRKVLKILTAQSNGHYVDGPILDMKYKSGVGWLPIPVVHGMTLGELGLMVNRRTLVAGVTHLRPDRHSLQRLYAPDPIQTVFPRPPICRT